MSEIQDDEESQSLGNGEVEIGSYNLHVASLKKGMFEYRIWSNITIAVIAMAYPNTYHRIDLRDKELLKKLEKEVDLKINYEYIEQELIRKPWLIQPNGVKEVSGLPVANSGKKVTKKQMKIDAKKQKIQVKIDKLKARYGAIKNKKCDRALKLNAMIEELETKKDRM